MQLQRIVQVCLVVSLAATLACPAQSATPNERGLWQLWVASTNPATPPADVADACKTFITQSPQDPFVVVARGLQAWCLLKQGKTHEATGLFESMLTVPENATPLQTAGVEMAQGWLTRIDREQVRQALKKLYLENIEFPESLDALNSLKAKRLPPLSDRWGRPWIYRRGSSINGMGKQNYVLESTRLGTRTDLAKMLALPYAGEIKLQPVKSAPVGNDTYEFASPSQKSLLLQVGTKEDGVTVAYLGTNLIILSDGNHWRVTLKPR